MVELSMAEGYQKAGNREQGLGTRGKDVGLAERATSEAESLEGVTNPVLLSALNVYHPLVVLRL
jgi:hypothetical protein